MSYRRPWLRVAVCWGLLVLVVVAVLLAAALDFDSGFGCEAGDVKPGSACDRPDVDGQRVP